MSLYSASPPIVTARTSILSVKIVTGRPEPDLVGNDSYRYEHGISGVTLASLLAPCLRRADQQRESVIRRQRGLAQLGMGLCGTAENQGLVSSGQTLLIVRIVQAKSDEGGAEAARSWDRLLQENHRAVDLSRVGCRNRWRIERGHVMTA